MPSPHLPYLLVSKTVSSMKWISLGQLYQKKKKKFSKIGLGQLYVKEIIFFFFSKNGTGQLCKKKNFFLNRSGTSLSKKTYKTPLGETGCLGNPYFTGCLSIQFFNSPLPLTQSVRPPMATYPSLCSTCVTYGTLCHARGHQVLPNPLDAYESFFFHCLMSPAFHPGFSDLWGSPPALSSTPTLGGFFLFFNSLTCGTLCHARGHSHSYLGKRRISPGVISILSMYLRLHT